MPEYVDKIVFIVWFLISSAQSQNLECSPSSLTSWGSCALVGLSSSLLHARHGYDIDKHDTVIRFGWPQLTQKHMFAYGLKQDVAIFRPGSKAYLRLPPQECASAEHDIHPRKVNPKSVKIIVYPQHGEFWPRFKHGRKENRPVFRGCHTSPVNLTKGSTILCAISIPTKFLLQFYSRFRSLTKHNLPPRPMTGSAYASALLHSKICKTLITYGIADPKFASDEYGLQPGSEHCLKCDSYFMKHLNETYENFRYII